MRKQTKAAWIVGETVEIDLDSVRPNTWNPNKMDPHAFQAIKATLREEGWLISDALLIWGSDEKGVTKNLIINGEHRWRAALDTGYKRGPAVFLHKLKEAQAKTWTVLLDSAHGDPDMQATAAVMRSIRGEFTDAQLASQFGFKAEQLKSMLAESKPLSAADLKSSNPGVHVVPLYLQKTQHAEFLDEIRFLSVQLGLATVTDVILAALEMECRQP